IGEDLAAAEVGRRRGGVAGGGDREGRGGGDSGGGERDRDPALQRSWSPSRPRSLHRAQVCGSGGSAGRVEAGGEGRPSRTESRPISSSSISSRLTARRPIAALP